MYIKWVRGLIVLAAMWLSASAYSVVISDVETLNRNVAAGQQAGWMHNLNDEPDFVLGSALSGELVIEFSDDGGPGDGPERASIRIEALDGDDASPINPIVTWIGSIGVQSLVNLNADGTLSVLVKSLGGDFRIRASTLNVTMASASVPEPATLAFLGLGLAGLAWQRRKA